MRVYIFRCCGHTRNVQRKYKSEAGESMGKPEKKLKKILRILGIAGAVYGVFRFLLPLVIPFLFAVIFAVWLYPSANRISHCLRWKIPGIKRQVTVPEGAVAVMELLLIFSGLAAMACFGGRKLFQEIIRLSEHLPSRIREADRVLTKLCRLTERTFGLKSDFAVLALRTLLREGMFSLRQRAMTLIVGHSAMCLRFCIYAGVFGAIVLIATGLLVQEMDFWKKRIRNSEFQREWNQVCERLTSAGAAYLRAQGMILILTTLICIFGFWLMKNPYYLLAGIFVGILDALPIFGVGTVLIPWGILMLFIGNWRKAVLLFGIYVVCYFLREILEAKLMSRKVGMTPFETLLSMYVGLELFGIAGFLLGPVGLLMIRDLSRIWETDEGGEAAAAGGQE